MSTNNNDEEQEGKETKTLRKKIETRLHECSKTGASINGLLEDFDSLEKDFEHVIISKETDVQNFAKTVNDDVEKLQNIARGTIKEIKDSSDKVTGWLNSVYDNALKGGFLLIGIITSIYYVYHLYENGWQIDSTVLSALLVIPITALFYGIMRSFRSKIDKRFSVETSLNDAKKKTDDFLKTRLNLNPKTFEPIIHTVRNVKSISYKTLACFKTYSSHLKNYYDSLEQSDRQELFRRALSNSLTSYGFPVKDNITEYFHNFAPLTNTPLEWLTQASDDLSKILGIPPVFITLMYSDYVGDSETSRDAWDIIKTNNILRDFIKMLIENKLVATEYFDTSSTHFGSIDALVKKQEKFSLEAFRSAYHQFYFDLAKEKLSLIDALHKYRFDVTQLTEGKIRKFPPLNLEVDKRQEELITFASSELGKPKEIIFLAFYEQESQTAKRINAWKKICPDQTEDKADAKTLRTELFEILVENELVIVPTQYRNEKQALIEYFEKKLGTLEDFTLAKANSVLGEEFASLEDKKKHILRALSYYNSSIKNEAIRDDFHNLLQTNDDENALCEWLSPRLETSKDILVLFYYDYLQDDRSKDVFAKIKETGQTKALAKTLLEKQIVTRQNGSSEGGSEIDNLSLLLDFFAQKEFNRRSIQFFFDKCNRLFDYEKEISDFLIKEKIIQKSKTDFSHIFEILRSELNENTMPLLITLGIDCLERDPAETFEKEWLSPIAISSLAIILEQKGDDLQFEACRKAAADIKTTKILYWRAFIKESDERDAKPPTPLKEIIESVIKDQNQNYEFLVPFKNKLGQGSLYPKIGLLVDSIIKELHTIVKEKQEKLAGMFHKITAQIRIFLGSQLNYDIVLKSLRMNLVSAYMITSPRARVSVMGEIIGNYLPRVCNEHAEKDSRYEDFLLISDEITGGKGTRLGIVPRGMGFDKFNEQFDELFREAVDRCIKSQGNVAVRPEDFAANLIRIVPSEAFFKRVIGGGGKEDIESPDHPINTIRGLVIDKYPALQNFELVAALKGGEEKPTIAMKKLIVDVLDTRSRIFLFVEEEIRPFIGETEIFGKIESGELDNVLVKEFNSMRLSDLCVTTYKAGLKGSKDFGMLLDKILSVIDKLQGKDKAGISKEQKNILAENIMIVLQSWGAVIEGFSEETSIGQTIIA